MEIHNRFIQIDEDGYFMMDNLRVNDAEFATHLFENLEKQASHTWTTDADGTTVTVEAFDEPLVARGVYHLGRNQWELEMPYGWRQEFDPHALTLDEWDRFHGETRRGHAFVLSRAAQAQFFNLCESFEDDSITVDGEKIHIENWLRPTEDPSAANFWNDIYVNEPTPGFDLNGPSPTLMRILDKIKLPKCRILIPGAGPCHDAAYLAEQGHFVTAVDFSEPGVARARDRYGSVRNLTIVQADVFALPREMDRSFDLVFEHTCYCAIDPARRNELVGVWRRVLVDMGHLLGIFFAMDKTVGPPFGGSEWEVRQRLKGAFQFDYWSRSHESVPQRLGKEFVVYATKKSMG